MEFWDIVQSSGSWAAALVALGLASWRHSDTRFNRLDDRIEAQGEKSSNRLDVSLGTIKTELKAEIATLGVHVDENQRELKAEIATLGVHVDENQRELKAEIATLGVRVDENQRETNTRFDTVNDKLGAIQRDLGRAIGQIDSAGN